METNELWNLKRKVSQYKEIRENTRQYREAWSSGLCEFIKNNLERIIEETGLEARLDIKDHMMNMEAVVLDLGKDVSGINERVDDDTLRPLIRHNGLLIYQQLFNGKIQVMYTFPVIEGFEPQKQPKLIAIYRPEELKEPFLVRHVEEFIRAMTDWEDFDDDAPQTTHQIGFNMNYDTADND